MSALRTRQERRAEYSAAQLAQRQQAIERANEVRTRRSEVKDGLDQATMTFEQVLRSGDDRLDAAKVADLLRAIHGVGPSRVKAWMRKARVSETTTLVQLNARQTTVLLLEVREHQRLSKRWRAARVAVGMAAV